MKSYQQVPDIRRYASVREIMGIQVHGLNNLKRGWSIDDVRERNSFLAEEISWVKIVKGIETGFHLSFWMEAVLRVLPR